jgi:anti-sigma regulatory factor (Ser/Thr protein kinase)
VPDLLPKETFEAKFANLAPMCEFVSAAAKQAGFSDPAAYEVELATNEAATNIIEYAYAGIDDGKIELVVEVENDGITIVLRDWGREFDADSVPDSNFSLPLEELSLRGAGIRLIRGSMDEVEYQPLPHNGNRLIMRKKLKKLA